MKKTLLLATALFSIGAINAQITITEANIASPLDVITQSSDTLPTVATPSGGANQTWDYSTGLVEHSLTTLSFTNPDWLNNSAYYPSATMAAVDANGFEIYFTKNASTFEIVGFAGDILGTGVKQVYMNPSDVLIQLPANFNDSYTTNSVQSVSLLGSDVSAPVDSILQKIYTVKTVTIDAWGSLTTPYGTYDVLRLNEIAVATDSLWAYNFGTESLVNSNVNTTYNYTFYSNNGVTKYPVMSMEHDNAGTVTNVDWLKSATVSINELDANLTVVYPNPAKNQITIDAKEQGVSKIEIFTVTGALVLKANLSSSKTVVEVSQLETGTYFYNVLDNKGNVVSSDKLVIR